MINCPICNKAMNYINNSHLKTHNLTPLQFKEKYPSFNNISDNARKLMGGDKTNAIIANKEKAKQKREIEKEKYSLLNEFCPNCNKPILFESRNNKFCNRSCAAIYNNQNRKVIYSLEAYKNLQAIGKKNLVFLKANINKIDRKLYKKECLICKTKFQVTYEKKLNKTCSLNCKKILHSQVNHRENKTFGKCGYYQGIYCASSWELAFLIYNKDLSKDIKRCDLTFNYIMNDIQHIYFPDFIMSNIIYEVKGRELEDVKFKTEAVIEAGYKIAIIRRKEILPIIKLIQKNYNVKDITMLYD